MYAFASNAAQYSDPNLFQVQIGTLAVGDDMRAIPGDWVKQFGLGAAHQYQDEIGFGGTFAWETRDLRQIWPR